MIADRLAVPDDPDEFVKAELDLGLFTGTKWLLRPQ